MSEVDSAYRSSFITPQYKTMNRKKALVNEFNRNRGEILESRDTFVSLTKRFSDVITRHVAKAHERIIEHGLSVQSQSQYEAMAAAKAAIKSGELSIEDAHILENIVEMAIIHEAEHGWTSVTNGAAASALTH